jgi:DNA-binding SARP family transcriptional activator
MPASLTIRLLGNFQLISDGQLMSGLNSPRLQSILAYLVLHRAAPQPRRQLAYLFWPANSEEQARTNLRKSIHFLRQSLPDADRFLLSDGPALQWDPAAPVQLDVSAFEAAASAGDLEQAIALYTGDLLPDCYDEWILPERERLRQGYLMALNRLMQQKEEACDYPAALELAQRILQNDPLREETHRCVMRLHVLNGDRAAALQAYKHCAEVLQAELGVEPSQATRQVYQHLLRQEELRPKPSPFEAALPLVGRAAEFAGLQDAWRTAAQGSPLLLLISGEAGIGKTRLVEEMQAWLVRQGFASAMTACFAMETATAYGPVAAWLRKREPAHLEPVWLREVARLAPELAEGEAGLTPSGPLAEAWQIRRFREALARAVLGPDLASSLPMLLVIEDLQWCDPDTLAWIGYLLHYNPRARLLVIGTRRVDVSREAPPLSGLLTELQRHNQLRVVELNPLDPQETALLGRQVLGRDLDPAASARLYQETEGNPLFVVEFARAGLVGAGAGLPDGSPAKMPPAVQAAIASRLAQLSPAAQRVMEAAATVGREFDFDLLAAVDGSPEEPFVEALDELIRRRVIRERGKRIYDFSHDKLRQVVYAGLSDSRKRYLHRRVAEALVAAYGRYSETYSSQIGWHYERARSDQEANQWFLKAGQAALRVGALSEAVGYLEQALRSRGERLPVGRRQLRLAIFREAVRHLFHRLWPRRLPAPIGRPVEPAIVDELRLFENLAWIETFENYTRQVWETLKGLNISETHGFTDGIVVSRCAVGLGLDQIGFFQAAEHYYRTAADLAERSGDPAMIGNAYALRAIHEIYLGRLDAAERYGRRAADVLQDGGDLRMWAYAVGHGMNPALYYAGKFAQCFELSRELIRRTEAAAAPQLASWGRALYSMAQRRSGRVSLEESITQAIDLIRQAQELPDYYLQIGGYAELARCYAQEARFDAAFEALESGRKLLAAHRTRGIPRVMLHISQAEVWVRAAEHVSLAERSARLREAGQVCREAVRRAQKMRVYLPEALRWLGTCRALSGNPASARRAWQRSLRAAAASGQQYDLALTHWEWGRRLGDPAHLAQAESLFVKLGVEPPTR